MCGFVLFQIPIGILSRENKVNSLPISAGFGDVLQILVENQGRINYGIANDFKGIIGDVLLNNSTLLNWTITGFPLENYAQLENLILNTETEMSSNQCQLSNSKYGRAGPTIFHGTFNITSDAIHDTYVDSTGWGKVRI